MKKAVIIAVALAPLLSPAQSWQWGKRAGGSLGMNLGLGGVVFDTEQVKSMLTDAQGNVYFNGLVGPVGLDCDGIPLQGYSGSSGLSTSDNLIASFDCSGNFRWAKVIGGYTDDFLTRIQNDSQGNVYASGLVYRGENETIAAHFDTDTILPTTQADGIYKRGLYLIKYSADGEYQWLRMPQPENTTTAQNGSQTFPFDLAVDPDGNSYWLTYLFPGVYADGQFTVANGGVYLIKYDSDGAFISMHPFQMTIAGIAGYKFRMFRNHANGTIYLIGNLDQGGSSQVVLGGQAVTHNSYLAAFDSDGQFLWKRENSLTSNNIGYSGFQNGCVDPAGNIYVCGGSSIDDVFLGYTMSSTTFYAGYVYKISPEGNLIWASHAPDSQGVIAYAVTASETTAAITGQYATLSWGGFSASLPPNSGGNVFLMTFDAQSGTPDGFTILTSDVASESPRAIVSDLHGNYYVGGMLEHIMYIDPPDDYIANSGQQTDLFIAKYGSADCSLAVSDPHTRTPGLWPNPVLDVLHVEAVAAGTPYRIHDVTGKVLLSGRLGADLGIDLQGLSGGMYLLRFEGIPAMKVVKR